ncbi:MAG: type II secretion system protein GspD [Desulfobacteraceae bacterium IS3]|nr:MAG: type II secretion system protein GspD [Desulfobacteraceae bacterium IS3]
MKSYCHFSKNILYYFFILLFLVLTVRSSAAQETETPSRNTGRSEQFVSIDFNDVDISVFIKFMSELTGKNFIVDNRVKGKVTIISPSKISVTEAYKVFESVLEVQGFATVDSGEVVKIIAAPDARTKNIETLLKEESRSPDDRVVTQLIPLKYADPNEIKRLFAPLVSKNSVILAYTPTNMMIITDVYSNIRRLLNIMKTIDVEGIGQQISVIFLEHGDAVKLVTVLNSVFQQQKKKKADATDVVKMVADERTNSIVLLASEDDTARIKELISRLDKETPRGTEKIRVYYLENATAEELAKVLQSLSQKQKPAAAQKGKKEAPIVSEGTNITADKATNSLIIMAEKDDYLVLEDVIKKLDIPRAMVYIECLIMEVNVNKDFNLGTEWTAGGKVDYDNKDAYVGGGFSGGGNSPYSTISGVAAAAATGGAALLPQGFSLGVFGEVLKIGEARFYNLGAVVQAYKKDKNVHILSTPQVLTTDNEEATITVGKNIPYLTKSGTTSTTVEQYNTYEYKDVGITLKVTPQISKDRQIRLKIFQEVTKLDQVQTTTGGDRPTTLKRTVDTTVIVNDKNTIVIGGLIDDSFSETQNKIPCFGDVPGMGWFFKSLSKGREKSNLFVFLTPHVVQNSAEAEDLYLRKKEHIDTVDEKEEEEEKSGGVIKMYKPGADAPVPEPLE